MAYIQYLNLLSIMSHQLALLHMTVHYLLLTWNQDLTILKKTVANVPNRNVLLRGPGEANRLLDRILRIALFFVMKCKNLHATF